MPEMMKMKKKTTQGLKRPQKVNEAKWKKPQKVSLWDSRLQREGDLSDYLPA
jgi:hypothetical protein